MKSFSLVITLSVLTVFYAFGQSINQKIEGFKASTNAKLSINPSTQRPDFISFSPGQALSVAGSSVTAKSRKFLEDYPDLLGVKDASSELREKSDKMDAIGFQHLSYEQLYKGVPVFDGQLKFHFNQAKELQSVNGVFIADIKLNPIPSLSVDDANALAINHVQAQLDGGVLSSKHQQLYIFRKGLVQRKAGSNHLVYEVEVVDIENGIREFVYVDAHSGEIVEQFTGNHGTLFRRLYENNTGNEVWTEGDALPGGLNIWQQNEVEAAGHTYYMFFNTFGFDSYDGSGAEMLTINNNPSINCPNANWNGVTANYCTGTASDDVVAHEWGHAYTEYTSGLIYGWQPGALNESYSDIWGETVDLLNMYQDFGENLAIRTGCNSSQRWRMGEDASAFGGAIRDMWIPTCNGDPGKVSDAQYVCGTGDNGGVHSNSGINNHAYALLVDGGTYNDKTITGIGLTKAAHIFWRSQSTYLTRSSGHAIQANALEMSANDLLGVNLEGISTTSTPAGPSGEIITAFDVQQVENAIAAVEMRLEPSCVFFPLLAESKPTCVASLASNAIYYEGFESGLGAWTVDQIPVNPGTWESRDWVWDSNLPDGRAGSGVFGIDPVNGDCVNNLQNGILRLESPVISIPTAATGALTLSFDHHISTEALWDGANIKYSLNGGAWTLLPSSAFMLNPYNGAINSVGAGNDNPMASQAAFTGSDGGFVTGSWGVSTIDLAALGLGANETIQLRFEMGTDGCNGSSFGWYLDNVRIYSCAPCMTNLTTAMTWTTEEVLLEAAQEISSTDLVNGSSRIGYTAGTEIGLGLNFQVAMGAIFEAYMDGCN